MDTEREITDLKKTLALLTSQLAVLTEDIGTLKATQTATSPPDGTNGKESSQPEDEQKLQKNEPLDAEMQEGLRKFNQVLNAQRGDFLQLSNSKPSVDKLKNMDGYPHWHRGIHLWIRRNHLQQYLDPKFVVSNQSDESNQLHVITQLFATIHNDIIDIIAERDAHDAYGKSLDDAPPFVILKRLEDYYDGERNAQITALNLQFDGFKLKRGESMEAVMLRYTQLIKKLRRYNIEPVAPVQNYKLLRLVSGITQYKGLIDYCENLASEITTDAMKQKLRTRALQLEHWNKPILTASTQSFYTEGDDNDGAERGGGRGRGRHGRHGRGSGRGGGSG